jgi:hypothetical protein
MERNYDLFERLQNNALVWRGSVHGLESTRRKLQELANSTANECFAMYTPTRQIVALLNVAPASQVPRKSVVFQIAYDEQGLVATADLLTDNGYRVISVTGNEAAKVILNPQQHCDLFIVGDAAPEQTRKEMVDWLKVKYPSVRILALNPPGHELSGADYNVRLDSHKPWLPMVGAAVR